MKKNLRYFMTLLLVMVASVGWADNITIDFESETSTYTDWTFTNIQSKQTNSNVQAHGGSYFGNTDGKTTGSVVTKEKIESPQNIVFYISKQSTNTTASSWLVKVSTDGTTWTQVGDAQSASAGITRGTWYEVERDLSSYNDVYVGIFYDGTTAIRCIDDVTLTYGAAPAVATPTFSPEGGTFSEAQSVTISGTDGASIYYTTDGSTPTTESTLYSGTILISETTTLKAIAVKGEDVSSVASATYTIVSIEHAGTEADPYTVADARAAIDANASSTGVYATGIVSNIVTAYNSEYANITFNFVDNEGDEAYLQAYRCTGDEAANVKVGDIVVVKGDLTKFNTTYEFSQGCQLISLEHSQKADPELSYNPTSFEIEEGSEFTAPTLSTVDGFSGIISYNSSNPNVATVDADGSVAIVGVGTTTITASFAGNENYLPGEASYTLKVKKAIPEGALFYESVSGYSGTSDVSTSLTTSNEYLDSEDWDSFTKVYAGKNGHLKFGTSNDPGTAVTKAILLTGTGKLTYKVQRYDSSNAGNLTITVSGATAQGDTEVTGTADWVEKTVYLTEATGEVVITFETASGGKRIRVDDIMVAETVLPDFYLAGSFNEWSTTSAKMTMQDDGTYTITQEMATAAEFKIVKTVGETTTWYGAAAEGETYWVNEENATNIALIDGKNFYMTADGTYTFTLDPAAMTLTITGWPETEYNLLGSFNGWTASDDNKLTECENGIYTITATVEAGATFKIKDSKGTWYGAEADGDFWITSENHTGIATKTDDGKNFYLQNAGEYTFTFNTSTKTLTVDGMALLGEVTVGCGIYQKVTSAGELEAGKRYLIVNEDAGKAFGGFSTTSTVYGIAEDATIDAYNDSQFIDASSSTAIHPVAFFASGDNWLIADGNNFLTWTGGNSLKSSEEISDNSTWNIAYSDGTCTIKNVYDDSRNLQYNSANPRFACYTGSQQAVAIYKELAEAPTVSTITLSPAKEYTTLTSAYALDFSALDGLAAYIVKEEDVTSSNVKLTQVSKVPANTGLVLQKTGEADSYSVSVFDGAGADDVSLNKMVGSATETTAIAANAGYILKDGKFSPSAEGTLAAGKAYLAVAVPTTGAKDLNIVFGEGTGINNVNVNENESGKIFNLAGQQMKSAVKGVYIKNGKKYIK